MWFTNFIGAAPFCCPFLSDKALGKYDNDIEFINCFTALSGLVLDRFTWNGLPDTCDPRMLELSLLWDGMASVADVDGIKLSLMTTDGGAGMSHYGYPRSVRVTSMNGRINKDIPAYIPFADDMPGAADVIELAPELKPKAVVGYDNPSHYPPIMYLIMAARRLSNLIRSADTAVDALKAPVMISCDEHDQKSVKEAIRKRRENEPYIIASKDFKGLNSVKVWQMQISPETLPRIMEHYHDIMSIFLEQFGFNSNPMAEKKERMITAEAEANNDVQSRNMNKALNQRKLMCEHIKALWPDLTPTVEINKEVDEDAQKLYNSLGVLLGSGSGNDGPDSGDDD